MSDYELSLELFDLAAEAAALLEEDTSVAHYTDQILAKARSPEDKLPGMYVATELLCNTGLFNDAIASAVKILETLEESPPRRWGDPDLAVDISIINARLKKITDEDIINAGEVDPSNAKRFVTLMKIYKLLGHCFHFTEQSFFGANALSMVHLTLENGLCAMSPIAFANYGEFLASIGELDLGVRLGMFCLLPE